MGLNRSGVQVSPQHHPLLHLVNDVITFCLIPFVSYGIVLVLALSSQHNAQEMSELISEIWVKAIGFYPQILTHVNSSAALLFNLFVNDLEQVLIENQFCEPTILNDSVLLLLDADEALLMSRS